MKQHKQCLKRGISTEQIDFHLSLVAMASRSALDSLPVLDMDYIIDPLKDSQVFVDGLFKACCKDGVGFFLVKNHGIPEEILARVKRITESFFSSGEEDKKQYLINKVKINNQGYSCLGNEKLDQSSTLPNDYKEAYNFGKSWSTNMEDLPPQFKSGYEDIKTFQHSCHTACLRLLEAFGKALKIKDSNYIAQCHSYDKTSGDILRVLHYPPFHPEQLKDYGLDPEKDLEDGVVIRAGAHSDYGSMTILFQDFVGGLQLLDTKGNWVDVPPVEGKGRFLFMLNVLCGWNMKRVHYWV